MAEKSVNVRDLVLDILLQVTRDGVFIQEALGNVLDKYRYLPRRDRAFMTRLSMGTIERMPELDYILNQYSRTPVRKMKPVIRCILRMGVYQLRYMDQVPDSAACNEAVKLAVRHGLKGLKGFVNGVMRNIARNKDPISWPDREKDPDQFFSVRYSMPVPLVQRFRRQFGDAQCEAILQAYLVPRPLTVCANTEKTTVTELAEILKKEGVQTVSLKDVLEGKTLQSELPGNPLEMEKEKSVPAGNPERLHAFYALPALQVTGVDTPERLPSFQKGLFYIQDPSSMLPVAMASPKKGMEVLDVCAAPGGKSIQASHAMQGTGHILSRDLIGKKTDRIRENLEREQISNVTVQEWDARIPDPSLLEKEDLVLADLPCSGLGVIAGKPDIKYHVTEEKIRELAALQREILGTVCAYVRPGGRLVYSTCTLTTEENQENTAAFLREHPEFSLKEEREQLPETWCDGFYVAVMEKQAERS